MEKAKQSRYITIRDSYMPGKNQVNHHNFINELFNIE